MSVKKVTIQKKDLPPLSPDGEYLIRYRVISEDKNRTSHWSPIYTLDATKVPLRDGTTNTKNLIRSVTSNIEVTPSEIVVTWGDENKSSLYDIFVSYKIGGTWASYFYHGSSSTHTYAFLQPIVLTVVGSEHTDVRVTIQIAGMQKNINNILTVSTAEKSLRASISGGNA
jgi:hypothetical protein